MDSDSTKSHSSDSVKHIPASENMTSTTATESHKESDEDCRHASSDKTLATCPPNYMLSSVIIPPIIISDENGLLPRQDSFDNYSGSSINFDCGNSYLSNDDFVGSGYATCQSSNKDLLDGILPDFKFAMPQSRSESVASLEYYRADDVDIQVAARQGLQEHNVIGGSQNVRQSKRLPFWMWYAIAKCLGIKLNSQDRPILATILYTLTFLSALGYVLCNTWFSAYDIMSDYTKTTVIDGTVSIFFSILWAAFGLYANKLAFRLFSHKKFLNMLRLHSKTILKLNASIVLFTIMLLFAIVNDVSAFTNFEDKTCTTVGVEVIVCKIRYIMRVMYSVFAVMWNYLVAFVVISVCRTHVIGIRKFMLALEQDARVYEAKYMGLSQRASSERPLLEENARSPDAKDILYEYTLFDDDYDEELQESALSDMESRASVLTSPQASRRGRGHSTSPQVTPRSTTTQVSSKSSAPGSSSGTTHFTDAKDGESVTTSANPGISRQDESEVGSVYNAPSSVQDSVKEIQLMTNSEILFRYWKIQERLRISSLALQRWMISIISLVVVWVTMNLMMWLKHDPGMLDLANFILPITLLPLLSSAYAEVNNEGVRLLKFISLVDTRLDMIYILRQMPLQLTVYGIELSYSTISTAALGATIAIATEVAIQELGFICLVEERLHMIYVLQNSPLQMTVFGFTLSYSTITTAAFGVLLAFASKILIQEIGIPKE